MVRVVIRAIWVGNDQGQVYIPGLDLSSRAARHPVDPDFRWLDF